MVYVFDHEGDIMSHAKFESVSTFLRGFPVPDVHVAGSSVAHRAAISEQSSGVRQEFINHLQMVIELHNLADLHFQRGSHAFSAALYWYLLLAEAVGEEVEGIDKVQVTRGG